jgi:hypothetical protein
MSQMYCSTQFPAPSSAIEYHLSLTTAGAAHTLARRDFQTKRADSKSALS